MAHKCEFYPNANCFICPYKDCESNHAQVNKTTWEKEQARIYDSKGIDINGLPINITRDWSFKKKHDIRRSFAV